MRFAKHSRFFGCPKGRVFLMMAHVIFCNALFPSRVMQSLFGLSHVITLFSNETQEKENFEDWHIIKYIQQHD